MEVREGGWKFSVQEPVPYLYTVYFLDKGERELFGVSLLEPLLIVVGGVLTGNFKMGEKYGCAVPYRYVVGVLGTSNLPNDASTVSHAGIDNAGC